MVTGAEFLLKYVDANESVQFKMICKNYACLPKVVASVVNGLVYQISEERAMIRRDEMGDLGVRIQTSGNHDVVGNIVVNEDEIRTAVLTCNFREGMLEGFEDEEEILKKAQAIKQVQRDYELFESILGILGDEEENFRDLINRRKDIQEIADEQKIQYDSAYRRMLKCRRIVHKEMKSLKVRVN
jgi:hypothetical protein